MPDAPCAPRRKGIHARCFFRTATNGIAAEAALCNETATQRVPAKPAPVIADIHAQPSLAGEAGAQHRCGRGQPGKRRAGSARGRETTQGFASMLDTSDWTQGNRP